MASKVIIGDLIVKVGVDSKGSAKQIKNLEKRLGRVGRDQTRQAKQLAKAEKQRVASMKTYLAQSRALSVLKKNDYKAASKAQTALIAAARAGDNVETEKWRRILKSQATFQKNEAQERRRVRKANERQAANISQRNTNQEEANKNNKNSRRQARAANDNVRSEQEKSNRNTSRQKEQERNAEQAHRRQQKIYAQIGRAEEARARRENAKQLARERREQQANRQQQQVYAGIRRAEASRTRRINAEDARNRVRQENESIRRQERIYQGIRRAEAARVVRIRREERGSSQSSGPTSQQITQRVGSGTNNLVTGAGMGILGTSGLAGAGVISSISATRDYRIGEQNLQAAYELRDITKEDSALRQKELIERARYYNLDIAKLMGDVGQMSINMPEFDLAVIEDLATGMGVLGGALGISNPDIARAMKGLQQFTVAQTAENLNQMTEAMPVLLDPIAKSLGVSIADLQKAKAEGKLKELVDAAGGMSKVSKSLQEAINKIATALFERNKNGLPNQLRALEASIKYMNILFGSNVARFGLLDFIMKVTRALNNNEAIFVAGGQAVGIAIKQIGEAITSFIESPVLKNWTDMWFKMSDVEKSEYIAEKLDTLGKALKALAGIWVATKIASLVGTIGTIGKALVGLATLVMRHPAILALTGLAAVGAYASGDEEAQKVVTDVVKFSFLDDINEHGVSLLGTRWGAKDTYGERQIGYDDVIQYKQLRLDKAEIASQNTAEAERSRVIGEALFNKLEDSLNLLAAERSKPQFIDVKLSADELGNIKAWGYNQEDAEETNTAD